MGVFHRIHLLLYSNAREAKVNNLSFMNGLFHICEKCGLLEEFIARNGGVVGNPPNLDFMARKVRTRVKLNIPPLGPCVCSLGILDVFIGRNGGCLLESSKVYNE